MVHLMRVPAQLLLCRMYAVSLTTGNRFFSAQDFATANKPVCEAISPSSTLCVPPAVPSRYETTYVVFSCRFKK